MSILNRIHDFVGLKIREHATRDALEALSERHLADLGLLDTDIGRLARLAAEPASAGLTIEELVARVRDGGDAGVGSLALFLRRLVGVAGETRDAVIESQGAARAASGGHPGIA